VDLIELVYSTGNVVMVAAVASYLTLEEVVEVLRTTVQAGDKESALASLS